MAILRKEIIGPDPHFSGCYDILCDTTSDLSDVPCEAGSMAYVRQEAGVYVKTATGWEPIGGASE